MNGSNIKKATLIKIIVAALAVAFVLFAGIYASIREKANAVPEETEEEGINTEAIDADNAVLKSIIPALPDTVSYNGLTRAECDLKVKNGSMIRLSSANGATVYINNYKDDAAISETVKTSESEVDQWISENCPDLSDDTVSGLTQGEFENTAAYRQYLQNEYLPLEKFKSWIFGSFAVFDADDKKIREYYDADLERYMDYIKNSEGISVNSYLEKKGYTAEELTEEIMLRSYYTICESEMSEAMLSDTIGDITDEELSDLAASNGYDSADTFIEENGRDNILYYLRPQKIIDYMSDRIKELP